MTMIRKTADVVIVGAGIMGLNTAWQIRRRAPDLSVVVLEKARDLGTGSSGYSSALLRCFYSNDQMSQLAADGLRAHAAWAEYTGLREPVAKLTRLPILWLTGQDSPQRAVASVKRLHAVGHKPSILSGDEVHQRFPAIAVQAPSGLADSDKIYLCEEDTGYFDPSGALRDLELVVRKSDMDVHFRSATQAIMTDSSGAATGVQLADGTKIAAGAVINTAGPWCQALNATAGLKLPWKIAPVRIQVIHKAVAGIGTPAGGIFANVPVVCDVQHGVYFRPQLASSQILVSTVRHEEEQEVVEDADNFNRAVDPEMRQQYLNAIHERMPQLPPRGKVSQYSALYTANFDDGYPLVGATPVKNFYIGNGFSGHGFKIAPAVGSLLARAVTGLGPVDAFDTNMGPEFLSPTRAPIGPNRGVLG